MIKRIKPLAGRVGVLGVGHHTYWGQFEGLLEELIQKQETFKSILDHQQVDVVDFGISDSAQSAYEIVDKVKTTDLDLLFIDNLTYATSSTVAILFREIKIPIVLVALQPDEAMDYSKASTYMQLYNDDICALPEFMNVAMRFGRSIPPIVIGTLHNDAQALQEIKEFCSISTVLRNLKKARIGQMGHVLEAMLDMHTDPTLITATFGAHVVQVEPEDVMKHYKKVSPSAVEKYKKTILDFFVQEDPRSDPITSKLTDEDLRTAAEVGVALEHFIEEKKLDGLAYFYESEHGSEMQKVVTNFVVGNSLLTAAGFPMCGELDLKTCIGMMIMDRLEMGGSFAEFHPVDFKEGFVLVGHDGPHHLNIASGKPVIRSLKKFHGKPGFGASVEFKIKEGPITMLGVAQKHDGSFKFIIAEGESVKGPIPPTGNTNTRGFFKPDVRTFLKRWFSEGPTHHFALGIGHRAETIRQIGEFLGIESVVIPNK